MFAPHCPTCDRRVLLGTSRIVTADLAGAPFTVAVRCFCGTAVDAFRETPPRAEPAPAGSPPTTSPPPVSPAA